MHHLHAWIPHLVHTARWLPVLLACLTAASGLAHAQGGGATTSIAGVVTDESGAMLPGANVSVKNDATSATFSTVTSDQGTFTVPALNPGTYAVTVSLMGFKTAALTGVVLNAGTPASVRVKLEVGGLEETVTVEGASSILQTQTAAVAVTMNVNQISNLPLTSRNALDFVTNLPGVNTPGTARDSTINGLPQGAINITIDGMSAQDNYLKTTDGFFARVQPRLDAVDEVTVSMAAQGAGSTGQGAAQIQFVTRSGTNELRGSAYYYGRHHALNANSWFNNRDLAPDPATGRAPKATNIRHQPGVRVGGPIVIPGLWDGHEKGFFFINYEEQRDPGELTRNRNVLNPQAEGGLFRYHAGGLGGMGDRRARAAANGQVATIDPTIRQLLADIRASTATTGQLADQTDPSIQRFTFQLPTDSITRFTTARTDFNLTNRHKLTGSFNFNKLLSTPDITNSRDPLFPGFPGTGVQDSIRYTVQGTLRSTLTSTLVNEVRVGATGGRTLFYPELSPAQFGGTPIADQGGFYLQINSAASGIANAHSTASNSSREATTKVIEDTLNWVKGRHSVQMGGSWTQADLWLRNQNQVPTIQFGVTGDDPANAMFNTTNLPGASDAQLGYARNLYAVLVGRVTNINGTARLDEGSNTYQYLGAGLQRARMREIGLFVADSWRWRPDVTLNAGLRYELQLPFTPLNDSYSSATIADAWGVSGVGNLFQPGLLPGQAPRFTQFDKSTRAYGIDKNNFAPSLGIAWNTGAKSGPWRWLLGGEHDSVLRAGYSLGYSRPGMSDFSDSIGSNPGVSYVANRNATLGNLGAPGSILLRNRDQLGPPAFPETRAYPMADVVTEDIHVFDPRLQTPYAQTWSAGWQRQLTKDMSVEIRYVGTRTSQTWTDVDDFNLNEINIVENGFLDEFRLAQTNLQANVAAGRGANFRYYGPGTGTAPLPIFLAYFSGLAAAQAGNASNYSSSQFASSTFVNPLAIYNPQPRTAADALDADAGRIGNALKAGLPANFLVANPDLLGGAFLVTNNGFSRYDALQLELKRRLSGGLQVQGSYVYGQSHVSERYSFRTPLVSLLDSGPIGGVTHAFKANWVYELPFGRDRRFAGAAGPWLNRLVGGWSVDGLARVQSGRLLDLGNVRLVGMTKAELQDSFALRFDDAGKAIYMLPQDIVDNTVKAFSTQAASATGYGSQGPPSGRYLGPANGPDCIEVAARNSSTTLTGDNPQPLGYGACGTGSLIVTGPRQVRVDLSVVKRTPIAGRVVADFRAEMLNAFNHPWFTPVIGALSGLYDNPDNFKVTAVGENSSRIVQLVARISW
jgi:hypothetical protein